MNFVSGCWCITKLQIGPLNLSSKKWLRESKLLIFHGSCLMCVTIDVLDVTGDGKKRNTCADGNGASTCSGQTSWRYTFKWLKTWKKIARTFPMNVILTECLNRDSRLIKELKTGDNVTVAERDWLFSGVNGVWPAAVRSPSAGWRWHSLPTSCSIFVSKWNYLAATRTALS